jgi:hypothetical protein
MYLSSLIELLKIYYYYQIRKDGPDPNFWILGRHLQIVIIIPNLIIDS